MIFIFLFVFIAAIFLVLNFMDSNNIEKIENYLKQNRCENIVYINGNYEAICQDKIMIVENKFSLELEKSKEIKFSDIKSLEKGDKKLIINGEYELKFKENESQEKFYKKLGELTK